MSVRVIAGAARGRRLSVPPRGTRPTSGLVRGALLTMLEHRGWLSEAVVLDLFAGSGALGIEAMSRGAARVVFVDAAPSAVRILRANVAASGLSDRSEVWPVPVASALRRLGRDGVQFDGVIADPPYGEGWVQRTIDGVVESGVLRRTGWLAVEHRPDEIPRPTGGLVECATRRHGNTTVTLLRAAGGDE
jgi:16S rRNA (guanine966-N2)-methyltransferase